MTALSEDWQEFTPEEWWDNCAAFVAMLGATNDNPKTWFWTDRDRIGTLLLMEGMQPNKPFGNYPLRRLRVPSAPIRVFKTD